MNDEKKDPIRLLVIDDEQGLRQMLEFSLGLKGYKVTCAAGGEEGVRTAKDFVFDAVVCDMMMPGMDGLATLKALKALAPELEVVMATGFASLESAVVCMREGAYDYIAKPYEMDDLCQVLERAVERKRLKKKVEDLEELHRLKSEFVANMSHELRTPMNAIMGYSSLLLDGVYGELPEKQSDALKRVLSNAKSLLELINSILDFSKLAAGRMPLYPENFQADEFLGEVAGTMESLAKQKGLSLCWEGAPLTLRADRTKLKQVLINLVGNALKFTDKGGVALKVERKAESAVFSVTDTGAGISQEHLPLLFQAFRQVDASPTRRHGGTGLGLSIVKSITELMGGVVAVDSELGRGSVFKVSLPLGVEPAPAEPPASEEPSSDAAHAILAIEDDPEVLKLLEDCLIGTPFKLLGAQSGAEGLLLAKKLKPFAITLDIMMPHQDGWSVLQALKADPETREIPVIIVSIVENKALGFSLGVADYVVKPFERAEIVEKLAKLSAPSWRRVIVVDDDIRLSGLLAEALEGDGYETHTAQSGAEALEAMRRRAPDLAILDLTMPGMDGFGLLDEMRGDAKLRSVPVIALTGRSLSEPESERLRAGVRKVILKGSKNLEALLAELRGTLAAGAAR